MWQSISWTITGIVRYAEVKTGRSDRSFILLIFQNTSPNLTFPLLGDRCPFLLFQVFGRSERFPFKLRTSQIFCFVSWWPSWSLLPSVPFSEMQWQDQMGKEGGLNHKQFHMPVHRACLWVRGFPQHCVSSSWAVHNLKFSRLIKKSENILFRIVTLLGKSAPSSRFRKSHIFQASTPLPQSGSHRWNTSKYVVWDHGYLYFHWRKSRFSLSFSFPFYFCCSFHI